jgi:hypothetical protein
MREARDAVFAALADPTRRRVLRLVAERGPTSATLLEHELPVTRQAIVTGHRSGQEVRYALVPEPLDEVSTWIAEIGSRWDRRLTRLRQVVLEQASEAESESELKSEKTSAAQTT